MRLICLVLFLVIPLLSANAYAEDRGSKHPIDVWLERHMSDDYSTVGMRKTTYQAQEMWEAEMNKVYKRLMSKLNPTQQSALREAQRQWLKFREAESKAIMEVIASQDGTIHQLSATGFGMDLVRDRTLKLLAYESEVDN